jgi:predicted nucleotidyltransferase component of viral defense system
VIPAAYVTEWSNTVGWPTVDQVEQDLVLSRLIIEIANDDHLGRESMFRGGTCLHKLHLNPARRYSEHLDQLISTRQLGYDIDAAAELVIDQLLRRLA